MQLLENRHAFAIPRHVRARMMHEPCPRKQRGRGECRVPNAPAAWCALGVVSMHTSIHSGGTGNIRHSPRNGFNGFLRALPGDEFLFATVIPRIRGIAYPVGPFDASARLSISNGCQDHTASPSASCAVVVARSNRSRDPKASPCDQSPRANAARVHRIPPRVRDDRDTPLVSGRNKTGTYRDARGESRGGWGVGLKNDLQIHGE